jgi:ketol-acid reductoisomerase
VGKKYSRIEVSSWYSGLNIAPIK